MSDVEPEIPQTDLEARFEKIRVQVGLWGAPLLFWWLWSSPWSISLAEAAAAQRIGAEREAAAAASAR